MFAALNGHEQVARVLLEAGAVVSAQNNDGVTALIWAAPNGHERCALVLLEAKADPIKARSDGMTALMFAAQNGHNPRQELTGIRPEQGASCAASLL